MDLLRRAWAKTIWADGAIPPSEGHVASDMKRGLLPVYDLILIGAAVLALRGGMPTFEIVYSSVFASVAAWGLLATSILCLIGISIPKLWLLEAISKIGLVLVLAGYAIIMLIYSVEDSGRGYTSAVMLAACLVPIWRIVWLGREYQSRGAK